jgi:hypothetical protein
VPGALTVISGCLEIQGGFLALTRGRVFCGDAFRAGKAPDLGRLQHASHCKARPRALLNDGSVQGAPAVSRSTGPGGFPASFQGGRVLRQCLPGAVAVGTDLARAGIDSKQKKPAVIQKLPDEFVAGDHRPQRLTGGLDEYA